MSKGLEDADDVPGRWRATVSHLLSIRGALIVVASVTIAVLVFATMEMVAVAPGRNVDSTHSILFGKPTKTAAGNTVWRVPLWAGLYHTVQNAASNKNAVTIEPLEAPVELRLQTISPSEPLLASQFESLRVVAARDGRSVSLARMVEVSATLKKLRSIDLARDRLRIRLEDQLPFLAEKSVLSGHVGDTQFWTAHDEAKRPVRVVLDTDYVFLSFETDSAQITLEPLRPYAQGLYAVWSRTSKEVKKTASTTADVQSIGATACRVCYRSSPNGECEQQRRPPTDGKPFRVLVVRSAAFRAGEAEWPEPGYKDSMAFLQELLVNTTPEWFVESTLTDFRRPPRSESGSAYDAALWIFTRRLAQGDSVEVARNKAERGFHIYGSLSRIRDQVGASAVVYVSTDVERACGIASGTPQDDSSFFAVVNARCMRGSTTTLAHEVGHLLGARHEITDDQEGPRQGHGYSWPRWEAGHHHGDVMSVDSYGRVPFFSDPNGDCDGYRIGNTRYANNRAVVVQNIAGTAERYIVGSKCAALRPDETGRCWNASSTSLFFQSGRSEAMTPDEVNSLLIRAKQIVAANPSAIVFHGFADSNGDYEDNYLLAWKRANSIRNSVLSNFPVNARPRTFVCAYSHEFRDCGPGVDSSKRMDRSRRVDIVTIGEDG